LRSQEIRLEDALAIFEWKGAIAFGSLADRRNFFIRSAIAEDGGKRSCS
jgi:hypothetical protein